MNTYILNVTKKNNDGNYVQSDVDGRQAVLLEAPIDNRGWIAVKFEEDYVKPWHRLHTSKIIGVTEDTEGITIETQNSIYKLIIQNPSIDKQ